MNSCRELIVPPMSARAFELCAGQTVRITDVQGGQPGDLVAFKSADLTVKLSQARTRVENQKVAVTKGDQLWTNTFPPEIMFTITGNTGGSSGAGNSNSNGNSNGNSNSNGHGNGNGNGNGNGHGNGNGNGGGHGRGGRNSSR